jgi:histidinol-phosphate phosphatase family protein
VRLLVEGASLRDSGRLALALAGLALRGHELLWLGGERPALAHAAGLRAAQRGLGLGRHTAEVVVGGPHPVRCAVAGWLVRARCMLLGLEPGTARDWGPLAHAAWGSLDSWGLIAESDGPALQAEPHGLDPEHIGLWPPGAPPPGPDATHPDTEVLERLCERALARHRGRAPGPGVFVDRDGTLVVERGYLSDPAGIELLPGAARALLELKAAGLPVIVISNQSGVGRGLFPLERVHQAMARLRVELRAAGVELDGIYFCPHRPEDGCACRKPGTLLLERAAEDHQLRLRASTMVGDKALDVETAHAAGARGILVRSGYGREEERRLEAGGGEAADRVCDDLAAAAEWILARREAEES